MWAQPCYSNSHNITKWPSNFIIWYTQNQNQKKLDTHDTQINTVPELCCITFMIFSTLYFPHISVIKLKHYGAIRCKIYPVCYHSEVFYFQNNENILAHISLVLTLLSQGKKCWLKRFWTTEPLCSYNHGNTLTLRMLWHGSPSNPAVGLLVYSGYSRGSSAELRGIGICCCWIEGGIQISLLQILLSVWGIPDPAGNPEGRIFGGRDKKLPLENATHLLQFVHVNLIHDVLAYIINMLINPWHTYTVVSSF